MLWLALAWQTSPETQRLIVLLFDSIASLLIGLILALTAAWPAYETKGLLIGERADPEVVRGIEKMALSHRKIRHINDADHAHGAGLCTCKLEY